MQLACQSWGLAKRRIWYYKWNFRYWWIWSWFCSFWWYESSEADPFHPLITPELHNDLDCTPFAIILFWFTKKDKKNNRNLLIFYWANFNKCEKNYRDNSGFIISYEKSEDYFWEAMTNEGYNYPFIDRFTRKIGKTTLFVTRRYKSSIENIPETIHS